jgi:hypothetical protein
MRMYLLPTWWWSKHTTVFRVINILNSLTYCFSLISIVLFYNNQNIVVRCCLRKTKLHGLSLPANCNDKAAKLAPTFADSETRSLTFSQNFIRYFSVGNSSRRSLKQPQISITFTYNSLILKARRLIPPHANAARVASNATAKHPPSCWLSGEEQYYYPALIRLSLSKKWEIKLR